MKHSPLFSIFLFLSLSVFAQSNNKFTFVTFTGDVFEFAKDGTGNTINLENGYVEIYFDNYHPNNLKNSCDCDEDGFECSVNIEKDTKIILVFKAPNYSKEVKDFLVIKDERTTIIQKNIKAELFKSKYASSIPIKGADNPTIKLFDMPRFDLTEEHTAFKNVNDLFFNKIELYGENINGRFLYFPDKLIDADGVWFKVVYQEDVNTTKQDSAFVYYDFTKEFRKTLQPAFAEIHTPSYTYEKDNYGKSKFKLKEKGPYRISNILVLETENKIAKAPLIFITKIGKWITSDSKFVKLLTEKEIQANIR